MLDMYRVHLCNDIEMGLIRTTFQSMKYIFPFNKKHFPCQESSCKDSSMLVIFIRVEVEGAQKARVLENKEKTVLKFL